MPARSSSASVPMAAEVPVTSVMLAGVRNEVLERIDQARADAKADGRRLEGKVDALEAKVDALEAKVDALEAKVDALEAKVDAKIDSLRAEMKADIHDLKAGFARVATLVEEQNARNKIVLDGLMAVISQHEQIKRRQDEVEETVRSLVAGVAGRREG